ncbi:hypothetical protein DKM44_04105 [Deinococcus irradiatisoli]|uniref:Ester cyclase n=1 Tax=Deinococcus irradiatisoli TaxID=2202254 RepID=A0A2Z3JGP7_9DEIO|nr:ester cyclase [Deinococcus irradiatisoli]AWN22520.1 hypothetical protein DKM44_04105 [Deinococcus irradiatisoli]
MTQPDLPIFDFADHPDIADFVAASGTRRQDLTGFDPEYADIVDYIVRCTHRIWEEGAVGLIYSHYAHNVTMHSTLGLTYGVEAVVRDTLRRQAAFTDYRSYADDVIWTGNAAEGFYTSHRIMTVGVNSGHTEYGPATGGRIGRWVVADCRVKDNRIFEEWIVSDKSAELRQLGYDPLVLARSSAPLPLAASTESGHQLGQSAPDVLPLSGAQHAEAFVPALLHNLWNARMVNLVREHYAPSLLAWVPGGRRLSGPEAYRNFVFSLMAQFSDLHLNVDHVCALGDERRGQRVATRWTLRGTHDGVGAYGAPTGRPIFLLGITHHFIQGGRIQREWTVFDEFALLRQLYAPPA